jgi:hypothetical protein
MVMNLDRLSKNIISIIEEVLKNQRLVNYLAINGNDPSISPPVSPMLIAPKGDNERIFPYPFDTSFKDDVRSQLHIYYPHMTFKNNGKVGHPFINFDIVVHKDIWLLTDKGEKIIRPYEILSMILDTFSGKIIPNLGQVHFLDGVHVVVNEQFEGVRLTAKTTEF